MRCINEESDSDAKIMLLGGPPIPGRVNPYDLPSDFFRIRLITTLLETCGMFFNKGAAGKKLDVFLSLFQVCSLHGHVTRFLQPAFAD